MDIVYNFKNLDFNEIKEGTLAKFIKLSKLLCNDGVIRTGKFARRKTKISKDKLMKFLQLNSNNTFRVFIQESESLNLLKRVKQTDNSFVIYVNPKYCRNINYIENKYCESLFPGDIYKNKEEEYFVYRFVNVSNEIIYVGKTKNIKSRICSHLSSGHLPQDCYNTVDKIEYFKCETYSDMSIYEIYYINKYYPRYNVKDKDVLLKGNTLELPDKTWKNYII